MLDYTMGEDSLTLPSVVSRADVERHTGNIPGKLVVWSVVVQQRVKKEPFVPR